MDYRCQTDSAQDFSLPEDECRALAKRILATPEFQRATKQREFLLYVLDRRLAGCPEDVTEALIGHRVYGRPASYNSGNDSIVRTEARTLRKKLEHYFATEGLSEPVVLEIPRGGYLPVFRPRTEVPPVVQAVTPAAPPPPTTMSRRRWLGLGGAAAAAAGSFLAYRRSSWNSASNQESAIAASVPGQVQFECSDARLTLAFQQAKQRALSCVYTGDPVGEWYATLPDAASNVFCMRDVAHQSTGASVLGLYRHTSNMLRRFATSVARSRDWCGYWIITKDGFAAPSAYTSDSDFGYCLPAGFDVMRTCYRQFRWTGDEGYRSPDFLNFYERTAVDYPATWDSDHDGMMENTRRPRVHASYFQQLPRFLVGADLVAAQYAGYQTYSAMQETMGREGSLSNRLARTYRTKADELRKRFNAEWWAEGQNRFYSGRLPDHTFAKELVPECNMYSLLFGIPEEGPKTEAALDLMEKSRPQFPGAYSYIPEVLFRYDRIEHAYSFLLETASPDFFGKDKGEVAFAVVGAIATGLAGISPDAARSTLQTFPRLSESLRWMKLARVPLMRNEITIEHRGTQESTLTNDSGPVLQWKATFPSFQSIDRPQLIVDGSPVPATLEALSGRPPVLSTIVSVRPGQTRTAKVPA